MDESGCCSHDFSAAQSTTSTPSRHPPHTHFHSNCRSQKFCRTMAFLGAPYRPAFDDRFPQVCYSTCVQVCTHLFSEVDFLRIFEIGANILFLSNISDLYRFLMRCWCNSHCPFVNGELDRLTVQYVKAKVNVHWPGLSFFKWGCNKKIRRISTVPEMGTPSCTVLLRGWCNFLASRIIWLPFRSLLPTKHSNR